MVGLLMNLLCRLGLHSWKPIHARQPWSEYGVIQIACQCRRCHKRVELP